MTEHPVQASIAAAASAGELGFGVPDGPGWVRSADLLDTPALLAWVERVREFVTDRAGTSVGFDVAVSHGAGWYFRAIAQALVGVWRADGRVVDLDPETTYVHLVDPWPTGVRIASPRFHAAANDPDATHPDALVAASEPELSAQLRVAIAEHARPFVIPLGSLGRIGRRTVWGLATDALVDAVSDFSANAPGRAEASALLADDVNPLHPAPDFRLLHPANGEPTWTRVNNACCLSYKAGDDGELCVTCPRIVSDAERTQVLQAQLDDAKRYAAEQALTA